MRKIANADDQPSHAWAHTCTCIPLYLDAHTLVFKESLINMTIWEAFVLVIIYLPRVQMIKCS